MGVACRCGRGSNTSIVSEGGLQNMPRPGSFSAEGLCEALGSDGGVLACMSLRTQPCTRSRVRGSDGDHPTPCSRGEGRDENYLEKRGELRGLGEARGKEEERGVGK